jgi:hypothetical protein
MHNFFKTQIIPVLAKIQSRSPQTELENRLVQNLLIIVHPMREDKKGYMQARKICKCTVSKLLNSWDVKRVEEFDLDLSEHSNEIIEFSETLNVQNILSGASTSPSPKKRLKENLDGISDWIIQCEEKVGGSGIEF